MSLIEDQLLEWDCMQMLMDRAEQYHLVSKQ